MTRKTPPEMRAVLDEFEVPLPYVDLSLPLKPREWHVHGRIPNRNVTLLTGEGATGKSLLAMLLSGATVQPGTKWIGTEPVHGPALYVSCEEDADEIRLRMEDVAVHLGSSRQEMIKHGLRVLSFAGEDAILAQPDKHGIMRSTPLLERIQGDAKEQKPKLIVIDTAADTFGGKEIDRAQTRQFITLLRKLAMQCHAALVLIAHPSLTGINTDSGLSGSTGWHNGPRARGYLKTLKDDKATNSGLRVLEFRKNNYGPISESILLHWQDGVFVVESGDGTVEQRMAEVEVGILFMKLLHRLAQQGRYVSDKPSQSYAPTVFAKEPEAKAAKTTKEKFAEAMIKLFAADKIEVQTEGPKSRRTRRIVEKIASPTDPSDGPSDALQTPFRRPSDACPHTPPIPPTPVGRGKGAFEAPAPSNGGKAQQRLPYRVVGTHTADVICAQCHEGCSEEKGDVLKIKPNVVGAKPDPLHLGCAALRYERE